MKKFLICFLMLLYLITLVPMPAGAQGENEDASVLYGSHSMDGQLPVLGTDAKIPNIKSAVLYEVNSDTLMYAWNADEKMAPASLTKILTALIAVEKADLNANVTIKEQVLSTVASGAVKSGLIAGEIMRLEDIIYCMMVDSGNDAAAVVAEYVSGSQAAFVQQLNEYAQKLGCKDTNFTNAHGLHDDNQYTTARDMGRILAAASKNDKFCEIFGTVFYTVPKNQLVTEERELATENALLNPEKGKAFYDEDVLGSRTGVDHNGFRCVGSIAEKNGLRFVVVVMGAASDLKEYSGYLETTELINLGGSGYKSYQLIYTGQVMKQIEVANGDCNVSLGTQKSISAIMPAGISMDDVTVKFENIDGELIAPIEKGKALSRVKYMYGTTCVAQTELYALNAVSVKEDSVQIEQPTHKKVSTWKSVLPVVIIIASVVLGLVAVIRIYVFVTNRVAVKKTNRRRNERRRSN